MDFSMITNRVATGAALSGPQDVEILLAAGINIIVDARAEFNDGELFAARPEVCYLYNPTEDDGLPKGVDYWQQTLSFVLPRLAQPGYKALLHCQMGLNRGPSNAFAVLVAQGLTPQCAEQLIRQARPQVTLAYKDDALAAVAQLGYG